jgi:Domain of unknown function (DUF4397)
MKGRARFGRLVRLLGLTTLAAGLLAGAATTAAQASESASSHWSGHGWLRLAHFSPNTPAVDVYLYSFHDATAKIVLHHVAYGTASPYEKVASGQYTVAMRLAGAKPSSPAVISTTVVIHSGHAYTVAGLGPAKGLRLQVLDDRLRTPPGKALVRIIQASLTQPRVTVRAGKKVLVSGLKFGSVTGYKVVSPGTWQVSAAGETKHVSSTITLSAGTIHTIVILDDPGTLVLDPLLDAAGSKVNVVGAPATGFGGTAPRPVPSSLPWIALIGGGILLCAAGAAMARRPRSAVAGRPATSHSLAITNRPH